MNEFDQLSDTTIVELIKNRNDIDTLLTLVNELASDKYYSGYDDGHRMGEFAGYDEGYRDGLKDGGYEHEQI